MGLASCPMYISLRCNASVLGTAPGNLLRNRTYDNCQFPNFALPLLL